VKSADDARRQILKLYDKDPTNWHILSGRDRHGYHDLVVVHDTDLWIIKEQLINPYKSVGLAVKALGKADDIKSFESPQCGIRPVSQTQIQEIVETIRAQKSVHDVLSEVMSHRPVSFRDLRSPAMVQGPILYVDRPIDLISTKQHDVDVKLKIELEKLLMKKYGQTIIPYL
jgi:hypothetical protein